MVGGPQRVEAGPLARRSLEFWARCQRLGQRQGPGTPPHTQWVPYQATKLGRVLPILTANSFRPSVPPPLGHTSIHTGQDPMCQQGPPRKLPIRTDRGVSSVPPAALSSHRYACLGLRPSLPLLSGQSILGAGTKGSSVRTAGVSEGHQSLLPGACTGVGMGERACGHGQASRPHWWHGLLPSLGLQALPEPRAPHTLPATPLFLGAATPAPTQPRAAICYPHILHPCPCWVQCLTRQTSSTLSEHPRLWEAAPLSLTRLPLS